MSHPSRNASSLYPLHVTESYTDNNFKVISDLKNSYPVRYIKKIILVRFFKLYVL